MGYRRLGRYSATIDIGAEPAVVYDLVADVTRTADYSPECRRTEWVGSPARPEVGARFRGQNRFRGVRWWREARISVAEPGRRFSFETIPGRGPYNDTTTWRYDFEPTAAGTRVIQSYEVSGPAWIGWLDRIFRWPHRLEANVDRSLRTLKEAAEDHQRQGRWNPR